MPDKARGLCAKSKEADGAIYNFVDCARNDCMPETICHDNVKSLTMVFGSVEGAESD